jgi:hypothetical protein
MEDRDFRAGAIDIQWLEQHLGSLVNCPPPATVERSAAIIAALIAERDRSSPTRSQVTASTPVADAWTRAGRIEGLR